MSEIKNELMTTDDSGKYVLNFASAQQSYSSLVPRTMEEKVSFFNAVNNPKKRLKEMVNTEIELVHIYAETIEFIDRETGEASPGVRIVLIDKNGASYQAASKGVFSSISKLLQIFGEPNTWKNPVKIRPKEISKGANRNVLVFELA